MDDMNTPEPGRSADVLVRSYAVEMQATGRTLDVRVVPYDTPAEVSDDGRTFYRETWASGAFDDQLVAGHRLKVLMNFEHERGMPNVIGKGLSLRSQPDGLHGTFEILPTPNGDTALELVNDGILDGVSLEATAKRTIRDQDGSVKRVKAHLYNVALCRFPAFSDARVLAVREEVIDAVVIDSDLLPIQLDPELVERLRASGIALPDRYQAHPAETDTPAQTGTSEDGTRQPIPTSSEEES